MCKIIERLYLIRYLLLMSILVKYSNTYLVVFNIFFFKQPDLSIVVDRYILNYLNFITLNYSETLRNFVYCHNLLLLTTHLNISNYFYR